MKPQLLVEWRRRLNRLRFRGPRRSRAATRHVVAVWAVAAVGILFGVWLRMYAGQRGVDSLLLSEQAGVEWRAKVDSFSASIPETIRLVTGESSWEAAALDTAFPRPGTGDESAEVKPPWRRILEVGLGFMLGYDAEAGDGAAAAPGAGVDGRVTGSSVGASDRTRAADSGPEGRPGAGPNPGSGQPSGPSSPPGQLSGPDTAGDRAGPDDVGTGRSGAPPGADAGGVRDGAHDDKEGGREEAVAASARSSVPPPLDRAPSGPGADVSDRIGERARDDLGSDRLSPSGSCRVLIFHSHTSETYRVEGGPDEHHLWNSTDSGILHVGRTLANALEEKYAVPTCHATAIHDWPSHARAYIESRATVENYLRRYPQIELVLDVHRDSPPELVTTVAGRSVARIAVVVGTHPTMHPNSSTNVALANHLGRMIENRHPGVFRRVIERPDARLNQDLHPRMILLEIGSYDTHLEEALAAAELLAEVVADAVVAVRANRLPGVGPPR